MLIELFLYDWAFSVSVSRAKEVPLFGPPIPEGAEFPKGDAFVNFLLAKGKHFNYFVNYLLPLEKSYMQFKL